MGVTVLVFAVELQKVRTKCIFSDFWERTGVSFKIECMWKGEESIKKIRFHRIYNEISHFGHNVIKKAFKWKSKWVSTSLTSTMEVLREEVEISNTRGASVMHIPNTLSHLGRKQTQAKIPIAFLFSQLKLRNKFLYANFPFPLLWSRERQLPAVTSKQLILPINNCWSWICLTRAKETLLCAVFCIF